ncbi:MULTISPECIES: hypothetical protein [unclassified Limnobacter]|uniref:hypothetical protein n=1 Tax=unclassified Limnobacter TaxID=2630203 RepID=UPI000C3ADFC8|nr:MULTISPECIES: hypothetical protein [unclassified Limnobacter]MAG80953.1 hypothetical protein [Sutterellaceae bacterium]MBT84303.1 hypothetical protein [Sutterellaceae bacterium]HAV74748.1 hypothetical protein [Limnobacter sp.]|tara:strand:- start:165 stop:425 length:261 start_codon:yes stop_codon:yes gene_type:complete
MSHYGNILSTLNYSLNRTATGDVPDLKLFPLTGLYRYFADAGRFIECASGLNLPVVTMGDNAKLENAYLQLIEPACCHTHGLLKQG